MGVMLLFEKTPYASVETVGDFYSRAMLHWLNKNVCLVDAAVDVELHKGHIHHLVNDLNRLTTENRDQIFPLSWGENEEDYWKYVAEVKTWAEKILKEFDFSSNKLSFSASW
ncbi:MULTISPECIES: hypothetical protein [Entomomonas]|uniref:Uncharacterized protein n=1 Tax=Entomomonas asaccharolytica TaxID=2785331 RepID=A0A974RZA9_9GAMM|nr:MULTISPECIES: hypothetical protein [Entomomonas]QQP86869.1 hypothetical protein JHT90_06400 [Entomomonas asaccharolytica]UYZ83513.1 hypothetical protein MTZ49_13055 [Entomomonas sp. E2T0]